MTIPEDSAERLRRANPLPVSEAPSPDSPEAAALFERIVASDRDVIRAPARPGRRVFRRRIWLMLPATLLAAAAGYGLFGRSAQPLFVVCYGGPSLAASRAEVQASPQGPVAACEHLWQPGGQFNPAGGPAPRLMACVLRSGSAGVFPGGPGQDVCSWLRLPPYAGQAGDRREPDAILRLQIALSDRFLERCVGHQEALAMAQQALAGSGLAGWRVPAGQAFPSDRPCASLAFDLAARTISIIPVAFPASP